MKNLRIEVISKYVGFALLLMSGFMLVSAAVSAFNGFDEGFWPLVYSGILAGIIGVFPRIFVSGKYKLSREEGYYIVAGAWFSCSVLGMLPYLMYGKCFTVTNALFETISGLTTTGASILNDIEALPKGLLFWRMSTAWIGGVGIIALFSLLLPSSGGNGATLTGVEMSSIALGATRIKPQSFAKITVTTYIVLTLSSCFLLKISGLSWFDATTHAMSACSTCGFSTKNSSIAAFDNPLVEAILIVSMLLASVRFVLLSNAFSSRSLKPLYRSEVTRFFFGAFIAGTIFLTLELIRRAGMPFMQSLRLSAFQAASIFTTTGFATDDTTLWPASCKFLIVMGSLVCGCSGSTSGGIKMDRAILCIKCLRQRIKELRSPNMVSQIKLDNITVPTKKANEALIFIMCYTIIIFVGAIGIVMSGTDITTAWTAAIACMGNVGPGMGSIGSMDNYSHLPIIAKYISMILMIVGRLEIFPILYVLRIK